VVTLRLLEGRKVLEAAHDLRLTPAHVAVLLHRAKDELRVCMHAQDALAA